MSANTDIPASRARKKHRTCKQQFHYSQTIYDDYLDSELDDYLEELREEQEYNDYLEELREEQEYNDYLEELRKGQDTMTILENYLEEIQGDIKELKRGKDYEKIIEQYEEQLELVKTSLEDAQNNLMEADSKLYELQENEKTYTMLIEHYRDEIDGLKDKFNRITKEYNDSVREKDCKIDDLKRQIEELTNAGHIVLSVNLSSKESMDRAKQILNAFDTKESKQMMETLLAAKANISKKVLRLANRKLLYKSRSVDEL